MENNRHRTVGTTTHTLREKARIKQTDGKRKGEKNKTNKIKNGVSRVERPHHLYDATSSSTSSPTLGGHKHTAGDDSYIPTIFLPFSLFFCSCLFAPWPFTLKDPSYFAYYIKHLCIYIYTRIISFWILFPKTTMNRCPTWNEDGSHT